MNNNLNFELFGLNGTEFKFIERQENFENLKKDVTDNFWIYKTYKIVDSSTGEETIINI